MLKLLLVLIAACATAEVFWWIIGAIALAMAAVAAWKEHQRRDLSRAAERLAIEAIAARADEQHALVLAGDVRGYFGDFPPAVI